MSAGRRLAHAAGRSPALAGRSVTRAAPFAAALLGQWMLHDEWGAAPFAPYSVAGWTVRHVPGDLATEAIERFGHAARDLLAWSLIAFALLAAMLAPRLAPLRAACIAAAATLLATIVDPIDAPHGARAAAAAVAAAAAFLLAVAIASEPPGAPLAWLPRRRVLRLAAAMAFAVPATALQARALVSRPGRAAPDPVVQVDGAFAEVPGISPRLTPPDDHYVVDINFTRPNGDAGGWSLDLVGLVSQPRRFRFDDLRALPATTQPIHLHCISNPVGGKLMGNSTWTGFPVSDLLALAGPSPAATVLRITAADGYDEQLPLAEASRALLVYEHGERPISGVHGAPVRLIYPGRYGMRSVKWIERIEIASSGRDGYWERCGWTDEAIMRTGARIDTPANGSRQPDLVRVAGVAWAGLRGVAGVELTTDGGKTWQPAQLEHTTYPLAWTRWQLAVDLPRGEHTLTVRAIDGTGAAQDPEPRFPHPSGATGLHSVKVRVTAST